MPASGTRRGKSATARPAPRRRTRRDSSATATHRQRQEPNGWNPARPSVAGGACGRWKGAHSPAASRAPRAAPYLFNVMGRSILTAVVARDVGAQHNFARANLRKPPVRIVGYHDSALDGGRHHGSPRPRGSRRRPLITSAGCRAVLSATAGPSSPRAANYLPLTTHVLALWHPGALQAELAGADLGAELRHYTRAQIWVLVPFWVAGLALAQGRRAA
jgi:hypothetical protein